MYCPRCSQEVTDETNFCPRCGFFFPVVRGLLATGGNAASAQEIPQGIEPSERQKGIRLGAKLVFVSVGLLPIFFGLCFLADGPAPLLVPFTIFLVGVLWMLYARLFREPDFAAARSVGPVIPTTASRPAMLPSPVSSVASAAPPRIITAEIAPPSVTEHTTNFLGQK
jgi:hypothetical protein